MEFANQPAILYTLALVGICGGLAPAACLALGAKLWRGRSIPLNHLLALVPTAILLLGGDAHLSYLRVERPLSPSGLGR